MSKSMFSNRILPVAVAVSLSFWGTVSVAQGDVEKGAKVFKKCASCHMVGPDARKRSGPPLNDIMNAPAGAFEDYRYSKAMVAAAADGLVWDVESLDAYLENPKGFLPKTKMSFRGLREEKDRADVIAYLATFSAGGAAPADVVEGFSVSAKILAIEGDVEYGEYLASECTTCHKSGSDDGIPNIQGMETEPFVTALHAFRGKHRDNSVMQLVAGRLSDEEIAALAVYFKNLEN